MIRRTDLDTRLVRRFLQERSEEAFSELYREHSSYLYGLALRFLGGRIEEAEEAVQEAWIRVVRQLETFRWEARLRTWMSGIVVNCCRELQRHRSAGLQEAERIGAPYGMPSVAERFDLERLLHALPDPQRQVLVLFDLEGYTHEEISRVLDIPTGTSKRRLFTARRTLRRRWTTGLQSGDAHEPNGRT